MKKIGFWGAIIGAAIFASPVLAQTNPCQSNMSFLLAEHGIKMNDMKNPQWQVMRFAYHGSQQDGPVQGYQFYGQPASCSGGELVASMTVGCEVSDLHTNGDCKVKGIPHWWW
jgi:hypothetical protein